MDDLKTLLVAHGGVLWTVLAARVGVTSDDVSRSGRLVRVRRGAFVDRRIYAVAGMDERYRLTVRAVLACRASEDLASHHAALALRPPPALAREPTAHRRRR